MRPVFGLPCQTANLWRIKILAQWCRSRHDEPPGFAMLNLTRLHLGSAHESQFQGLGINLSDSETAWRGVARCPLSGAVSSLRGATFACAPRGNVGVRLCTGGQWI